MPRLLYLVEVYETINAGAVDQGWRWRNSLATFSLIEATQKLDSLLAANHYARMHEVIA